MIFSELRNCGKRESISSAPPIQCEYNHVVELETNEGEIHVDEDTTIVLKALNFLVIMSGTQAIFYILVIILIIWLVIGIIYKAPVNWQVVMEDGQSIQCYIWDTLLMRQQLIESSLHLRFCADVRSRLATYRRLLKHSVKSSNPGSQNLDFREDSKELSPKNDECQSILSGFASTNVELPDENWFDKASKIFSELIGSLPSIILYWVGSFVWVGCGALNINAGNSPPYTGDTEGSNPKYSKWSNNWQLYINTAVAVVILFTSTFLQNIRTRHEYYIHKAMKLSVNLDKKLELTIRIANDNDSQENILITSEREKRGKVEKCIDYYADVIGCGVGVAITTVVFGVWIGVGTLMHWSSNWWLIIGTYTGLVGFFDGFVLREVYFRITDHEEKNYKAILDEYQSLIQYLGLPHVPLPQDSYFEKKHTYTYYSFILSRWINKISSSKYSVILSLFTIIGLVVASSVMKWSTTGQLIANTPTMIIEGFFLIILIQAHNTCDYRRRLEYKCLYDMQSSILQYLDEL